MLPKLDGVEVEVGSSMSSLSWEYIWLMNFMDSKWGSSIASFSLLRATQYASCPHHWLAFYTKLKLHVFLKHRII